MRYVGGAGSSDTKKFLTKETYDQLLVQLSSTVQGANPERTYLQKRLGDFTRKAHHFGEAEKINCRTPLAPFYNEMGHNSQSAVGFLQLKLPDEESFIEQIATGKLGMIRDNCDILLDLQNMSPILYTVYASLQSDI